MATRPDVDSLITNLEALKGQADLIKNIITPTLAVITTLNNHTCNGDLTVTELANIAALEALLGNTYTVINEMVWTEGA